MHIGQIEELWVGAKKYRVPEKAIHLDFWRRVDLEKKRYEFRFLGIVLRVNLAFSAQGLVPKNATIELEDVSGGSSPLTELSTDGEEEQSALSGKVSCPYHCYWSILTSIRRSLPMVVSPMPQRRLQNPRSSPRSGSLEASMAV